MDINIEELIDKLSSLEGDEKEGAVAALARILQGKGGGGGSMPLPPEIDMPVDPDLDEPEDDPDDESTDPDDIDIDDPDDVLKPKKGEDEKDSDKKDDKESDNKDSDGESGEEESEDDGKDSDGEDSEEDEYEDDGGDSGEELMKDKEREEKKKADSRSKRSTVNRVLKEIAKAEAKAEPGSPEEEALSKAKEALEEIADLSNEELSELDEQAFTDIINDALDAIDKISPVHRTKDLKDRIEKIKDDMKDTLSSAELDREDDVNYKVDPEYIKKIAAEAEKEKYKGASVESLEQFKIDFENAIEDQVAEYEDYIEETNLEDERYSDMGVIKNRERTDSRFTGEIPTIDVYFDQSGSWGTDEVNKGMDAIKVIEHFEEEGKIQLNIWYFSKILSQDQRAARAEGSQECWDLVVDQILAEPKTKNVVIVTDQDITHNYGYAGHHGCIVGPHTHVEGCVWWIWKHNYDRAPEGLRALYGDEGTAEYALYS